jgi:hypothetical protein
MTKYVSRPCKFQLAYLGNESGLFGREGGEGARTWISRGQCCQDGRKLDAEHCTASLSVVAEDIAAVFAHDTVANAEPQASPFSNGLGGVEGVKYAVWLFYARSRIGKQHNDVAAVAQRTNREYAASGHSVDGIVNNIEENLHQLVAVAANPG